MIQILISLYLICLSSLSALISETSEITDILSSIEDNTLVLFDLDDTVIDSAISLNSGKWIQFYWQVGPTLMPDQEPLLESLMHFISHHVPVKLVQAHTADLIATLQPMPGCIPLALTARSNNISIGKQLSSIGVDFTQTRVPVEFANTPSFQDGIIFTSGKKKGTYLHKLLHSIEYRPNKVVFIDDKLEQVQSVDAAMQEWGVECHCFWYRRAENERLHYSHLTAITQLVHLVQRGRVISDEEALRLRDAYAKTSIELLIYQILLEYRDRYYEK